MSALPELRQVSQGMYDAWRLARLDSAAMAWFDRSSAGVWRSFWAAALAYPGFIALIVLRVTPEQWSAAGPLRILSSESIGYVIGWTAFPLVILPFCRWIDRDRESLEFITAYNWSQVIQTAVALAGLMVAKALPAQAAGFFSLAVLAAQLGYEWFIARTALAASGAAATAVVLIDLVLGEIVNQATQSLY